MTESKFNVGDLVRANYNCNNDLARGEGRIYSIDSNGCMIIQMTKASRHYSVGEKTANNTWGENIELVKKGKAKKVRPIEKHCILIDSCDNYEAKFNSYKEAEEHAKSMEAEVTIYKLVAVAKVKSQRQVRKVTSKRKLVGKR